MLYSFLNKVTICLKIVHESILFGLVYLFIRSVTHVTLDTSITDYNLQHIL